MPGTPPDSDGDVRIVRHILFAIALVALAAALWRLRPALVIAFGGIVAATLLRTAARPLARWTGLPHRGCVVIVLLLLLAAVAALAWLFGAEVSDQFILMRDRLPQATQKAAQLLERFGPGQALVEALKHATADGDTVSRVGVAVSSVLAGFGNLLLIVFAGAYFAFDPQLYRRGALRLLPPSRRPQVGRALEEAGDALGKWLIAQLIVMFAVGSLTGIGLAVLGVPSAFSLALLIGVLEFVPVLGPIVAAVPGILLALGQGVHTAVYAAGVYIVVQQLESNLLTPLIQRWAVELPPVVALLSIVAGGLLFGPLGVLFATPLAVVTMSLVQHLYVEDTIETPGAARTDAGR